MPDSPANALSVEDVAILMGVVRSLVASPDLYHLPEAVTRAGLMLSGARSCVIERWLSASDETIVLARAAGPDWTGSDLATGDRVSLDGWPAWRRALDGEAIQCDVEDERLTSAERERLRRWGVRSLLVLPIRAGDESVGLLSCYSDLPDAFPSDRVPPLEELATISGMAILQRDAYRRARRLATRLGAVAMASAEAVQVLDLPRLLERIPPLMVEAFGHYLVNVFLVDPASGALELRDSAGYPAPGAVPFGERVELGQGIVGHVATTSQPYLAPDTRHDPHYVEGPGLETTRSEVAAPLVSRGVFIGVLDVQSREVGAFDESDAQALAAMATAIGATVENARLVRQVRDDEHRLRAIMDAVPSPLGVYDAGWYLQYVNEAMIRLYAKGDPDAIPIGAPFTIVAERLAGQFANPDLFHGREEGGMRSPMGDEVFLKDPPRVYVREVTPVVDDEQRVASIVLYRNVTDERAALRAKDRLLSIAAHELRTPLTALLGFIDLSLMSIDRDNADPATVRVRLVRTQREARRLGRLVEELLDMARVESGASALRLATFDLGALVREVVERFEFGEMAGRVVVEAPEPVAGGWDEGRIDQILTNIISNALTYAPAPTTVRIVVREREGRARVEVRDQGPGLSPQDLARLFQPFVRVGDQTTVGGGMGLGLHVSRVLAERHGGRLWLESEPGRGTVAILDLPLTTSPEKDALATTTV